MDSKPERWVGVVMEDMIFNFVETHLLMSHSTAISFLLIFSRLSYTIALIHINNLLNVHHFLVLIHIAYC